MWKRRREIGEKGREERMVRQGKVNDRMEKEGRREKKMGKILDRILRGKEGSPPIYERIWMKEKKEKREMERRFQVTLSLGLTTYQLPLKRPLGSAYFRIPVV